MTSPSSAVVLIGPMGAGKTSVGKRVARRLGRPFIDSDKAIVAEHGPIPAIFAERGESGFRLLERAAVQRALATAGVVALGGGAVLEKFGGDSVAETARNVTSYLDTLAIR